MWSLGDRPADSCVSSGGNTDRRTSTPNPNSDCLHLHPAAHHHQQQQQAACGQLTTSLLTAHTASAQLKLHFSKQDAAA